MSDEMNTFEETIYIYHSSEDQCWIANGLRTDQIGVGPSVMAALADAIKAIDQIIELARQDKSIAFLREAPPEIQEAAKNLAKPLPKEIYEIAHRRARGDWPDDVPVEVPADDSAAFTAEMMEGAAC